MGDDGKLMELLFEQNRNMYLEYFKLTNKDLFMRRLKVMIVMAFLFGVIIYSYNDSNLIWLLLPVLLFIGYKIPYYELMRIKSREDIIREMMFPTFLRYFVSLVGTQGNVYQTLRAIVRYIEDPLKTELVKLIKKLDDKNYENYQAYMDFADFIGSSEAYMIMGVIQRFDEEGINKKELQELELMVKNLQENKVNEAIERKVHSLEKHADPILVYGLTYIITFTLIVFFVIFSQSLDV